MKNLRAKVMPPVDEVVRRGQLSSKYVCVSSRVDKECMSINAWYSEKYLVWFVSVCGLRECGVWKP